MRKKQKIFPTISDYLLIFLLGNIGVILGITHTHPLTINELQNL